MEIFSMLCTCGLLAVVDAKGMPRIAGVGRMEADPGEFPYLAVIMNKQTGDLITSGVLIRPRVVLTIGYNYHRDALKPSDIVVAVGTHNLAMSESTRQDINVSKIAVHPGLRASWQPAPRPDLALIQLAEDVQINRRVRVFYNKYISSVPKQDNRLRRATCVTYGYGLTNLSMNEEEFPMTLQKYNPEMKGSSDCDVYATERGFPWSSHYWLCSVNEDLTTSRMGDGGNPLLCQYDDGDMTLHGLTSGAGSGWVFYTRLSRFRSWIIINAKRLQDDMELLDTRFLRRI